MGESVEVVPFFERFGEGEEGWTGESYVAGLRNPDGKTGGVEVLLPAEIVEQVVFAKSQLSLSLNPDGTFTLQADGLSHDTLDAASRSSITGQSLGSLLNECLHPDLVAMEDDAAADLASLRAQLSAGLAMVDRALEELNK